MSRAATSAGVAPAPVVEAGPQPDVLDAPGRPGEQGDVAEDARQPPLVLVLDIAGGGPLVYADGDDVVARAHGGRHVELVGQPAATGTADLHAVHPHPEQ